MDTFGHLLEKLVSGHTDSGIPIFLSAVAHSYPTQNMAEFYIVFPT